MGFSTVVKIQIQYFPCTLNLPVPFQRKTCMVYFWEAKLFLQCWYQSSQPSLAVLQGRPFFVIVTHSTAWSSFLLSINKSVLWRNCSTLAEHLDVHLLIAESMTLHLRGGGYGLKKAVWCRASQVRLFFSSYRGKESKIYIHRKCVCIAEGTRSLRSFRPAYSSVLRYWNLNLMTQDGFRCSGRIISPSFSFPLPRSCPEAVFLFFPAP